MKQQLSGAKKIFDIPCEILSAQSLKKVQSQDPSLSNGFNLLFEKNLEFKFATQDINVNENLRVRILDQHQDDYLENMKVELTSDNDLFFHFVHTFLNQIYHRINDTTFQNLKDIHQLHIEFEDYPATCVKLFDNLKDKGNYVLFQVQQDGSALVTIHEKGEYNLKELLQMEFFPVQEDQVKLNITFKVMSLKHRLQLCEERLIDVQNILRVRAPNLFQESNYKKLKQGNS